MTETIIAAPLALTLHWENDAITRLDLLWSETVTQSATLSPEAEQLQVALGKYVSGEGGDWPELPFSLESLTPFQRTVLEALAKVPRGATCTYGELGARIGKPKAAQAIGRAMASNPFPLVYPCHRIIGNTGAMTGFSAQGGIDMKQFLLRHEGAIL